VPVRLLLQQADRHIRNQAFDTAAHWIDQASRLARSGSVEADNITDARTRLALAREQAATELANAAGLQQARIQASINADDYAAAEAGLARLIAMGDYSEEAASLRASLQNRKTYGRFSPGEVFQDEFRNQTGNGPFMVVIRAGSFFMGTPANEPGRQANEGPQRRVRVERGFAIGLREISVADFRQFIEDSGYVTDAESTGHSTVYNSRTGTMTRRRKVDWTRNYLGRDADPDLPVIHVSWNDASAYARWLSSRTGETYRLPSEAEFEYALRGGSAGRYWWGNGSPDRRVTNTTGEGDISDNRRRWNTAFEDYEDGFWGPAPVASFEANGNGLYDIGGNVSEWTLDCWHNNYVQAPVGPQAWLNPGCTRRVVRGGSWSSSPEQTRSGYRAAAEANSTGARVGFRLVREI